MLLGIAVKWFSNSTDSQLQKTPAKLKELQKNRWLVKIRAEIEKDYEVGGVMFPFAMPCYYVTGVVTRVISPEILSCSTTS